jgi:carbon storage regulator
MLILTRKPDESVMIGKDIEVKVLKVTGSQVHLGIIAPRSVQVYRHEIFAQVMAENQKAVAAASEPNAVSSLGENLQKLTERLRGKAP